MEYLALRAASLFMTSGYAKQTLLRSFCFCHCYDPVDSPLRHESDCLGLIYSPLHLPSVTHTQQHSFISFSNISLSCASHITQPISYPYISHGDQEEDAVVGLDQH